MITSPEQTNNSKIYKEKPPVNKKSTKKHRMEYKELEFKDGCTFKGMVRVGALIKNKKKYLTGTGELHIWQTILYIKEP